LAKHTRKTVKQIAKDTDRDNYMDPEQSKEYGLIDVIISDRNNIRNIKD
jgi:ATP-dependent Clp protease protease subunit